MSDENRDLEFERGFDSDVEPTKTPAPTPHRQQQAQAPAPVYREPEPDLPEDVQNFFEDYPEFKKALDVTVTPLKRELGLQQYIHSLHTGALDDRGQWQDGLRDATTIAQDPEYQRWYDQRGYGPCSAGEGIRRLREFKSSRGGRPSRVNTRGGSGDDFERAFYG